MDKIKWTRPAGWTCPHCGLSDPVKTDSCPNCGENPHTSPKELTKEQLDNYRSVTKGYKEVIVEGA